MVPPTIEYYLDQENPISLHLSLQSWFCKIYEVALSRIGRIIMKLESLAESNTNMPLLHSSN